MEEDSNGGTVLVAILIVSLGFTLLGIAILGPLIMEWHASLGIKIFALIVEIALIFNSSIIVQSLSLVEKNKDKE